ncbi:MAG: hypothetical protein GWN93_05820 [Deltaproteobacteria bacterium]|nr:hypothetical protein [Deltaproteobacteria bacterium]
MSWPASLWSIGAVDVYVNDADLQQDPVIGEVHVLDALKTTKHHSGSTGLKGTLAGILVTTDSVSGLGTELVTLKGYTTSITSRAVVGDQGSLGDFKIKSVQAKRKQALNYDYPIYEVRVEVAEA